MASYKQIVTLNPGESKSVSFQVVPTGVGIYTVSVDGLSGSFEVLGMSDIRVSGLSIIPSKVYPGDTVTISVVAINSGTATDSKEITCTVS